MQTSVAATGSGDQILVVEDESGLAEAICYQLKREGFRALAAPDGVTGLRLFREVSPSLVILDVRLPGMSGLDLCRTIRTTSVVPIIILSARDGEADKVVGLELGADDYMTKPFSMRELLARVRAQLRRAGGPSGEREESVLAGGPIEMDIERHEVRAHGRQIELPPKEFALLEMLLARRGRLVTRETLISNVWGYDYIGDTKTLDVHVKRLRAKIEEDPHKPSLIRTVRGLGYKLEA